MNILITGTSSGIGMGLAKHYALKGAQVYGISRREPAIDSDNYRHLSLDLTNTEELNEKLPTFIQGVDFDLCVMNAGALGKIQPLQEADIEEMKSVMDINVWAVKSVIDCVLYNAKAKNIICISSGAAVNGNYGWSGYSISKAALNMLVQLYAKEVESSNFYALAPGLVDTSMQDYLWNVSEEKFPSVKKLHDARGTKNMPKPDDFGPIFEAALTKLYKMESGSFADVRKI